MVNARVNIDSAKRTLLKLLNKIDDKTNIFQKFIPLYQKEVIERNFANEGKEMTGSKWPALTKKYEDWKNRSDYVGRTMGILTGAMRTMAIGGSGFTSSITKDKLVMSISGLEYMNRFQYGYKGQKERPFFHTKDNDIPPRAYALLIKLCLEHIKEAVR